MTDTPLLDRAAGADDISISDQIEAVDLWVLGLEDWIERFAGSRKRPEYEVSQYRERLRRARAVGGTLRGVQCAGAGR